MKYISSLSHHAASGVLAVTINTYVILLFRCIASTRCMYVLHTYIGIWGMMLALIVTHPFFSIKCAIVNLSHVHRLPYHQRHPRVHLITMIDYGRSQLLHHMLQYAPLMLHHYRMCYLHHHILAANRCPVSRSDVISYRVAIVWM
jgi:hypothetical protein